MAGDSRTRVSPALSLRFITPNERSIFLTRHFPLRYVDLSDYYPISRESSLRWQGRRQSDNGEEPPQAAGQNSRGGSRQAGRVFGCRRAAEHRWSGRHRGRGPVLTGDWPGTGPVTAGDPVIIGQTTSQQRPAIAEQLQEQKQSWNLPGVMLWRETEAVWGSKEFAPNGAGGTASRRLPVHYAPGRNTDRFGGRAEL